jgi:ankyrin repeat protein
VLHSAVFHNFYDQVVLQINYLKKRFDNHSFNSFINSKSKEGFTPILLAAYKGNIEIIKLLIEHGADYLITNKSGLSILHMAAQGNQPAVIVFFKEKYNKDLNEKDNVGSTVLHWSCYSESLDVLNLLLSYNITIDVQDGEGNTPLLLSITFGKNLIKLERIRIIKKLIQYGADKEIKNNNGENALNIIKKKNLPALNEIFLQNPYPLSNIYFKKPPIEKLEGTRQNIFFFIVIHLIITVLASLCIIKPILLHSHFGFYISYIYYLLFITIMGLFSYLIYSDPGKIVNPNKITLLVLIYI